MGLLPERYLDAREERAVRDLPRKRRPLAHRQTCQNRSGLSWPAIVAASEAYAEVRRDLEAKGTPIGSNDLLIAAHALHLGCTLVTNNTEEFKCVRGLGLENWI